jgi:hypothetical protein
VLDFQKVRYRGLAKKLHHLQVMAALVRPLHSMPATAGVVGNVSAQSGSTASACGSTCGAPMRSPPDLSRRICHPSAHRFSMGSDRGSGALCTQCPAS